MKRVETVANLHNQPITLDSGVILAPKGYEGSRRSDVVVSEADERRHVPHRIALIGRVSMEGEQPVKQAGEVKQEAPATIDASESPAAGTPQVGPRRREQSK